MATLDKPLEQRVHELETLVWEIPNILNLRFDRFDGESRAMRTAVDDNTSRLILLERSLGLMQIDMRDLRGGVTQMLIAQDRTIADLKSKVGEIYGQIGEMLGQVDEMRGQLGEMLSQVGEMRGKVGEMGSQVGDMRGQISGMAAREAARDERLDAMSALEAERDAKLDQILVLLRAR